MYRLLALTDARTILFKSNPWVRPWVGFKPMISELQGRKLLSYKELSIDILVYVTYFILDDY